MRHAIPRRLSLGGLSVLFALVASLFVLALPAAASNVIPDAIWADGSLYGTVVTPTNLPDKGNFDRIYSFGASGLAGQRSISDSKPGDQDFNGGRWEVHLVQYTASGLAHFDQNGDGVVDHELTSDAQLMTYVGMGYLSIDESVVKRFVCTMIPM